KLAAVPTMQPGQPGMMGGMGGMMGGAAGPGFMAGRASRPQAGKPGDQQGKPGNQQGKPGDQLAKAGDQQVQLFNATSGQTTSASAVARSEAKRRGGVIEDLAEVEQNVRNLGTKTFYRKADRWVDSEVKPEEETKAVVLEQFSDEFFKVARNQSAEQNQYFTF